MKKINYSILAVSCWLFAYSYVAKANPVTQQIAETVAENFYTHNFRVITPNLTLAYTELSKEGQAVYYIFNVNANNGFVIVSAEDATHPILGYSDKGQFVLPKDNNNVSWWMNCRKQEISIARLKNVSATPDISNEWTECTYNRFSNNHRVMGGVLPLLSSTWNQSPGYNALCPGGSVTGCVATAMAQIMRYWQYPAHGHGYNTYLDQISNGYQRNYGRLSANFDSSNYVWSSMPLNNSSNYSAELMYDCGISVDMDYSTGGSAAWVIDGDYPVCAQNSYVKYFGYNKKTIQGVYMSSYTYTNWINLIENELNNSRPVQYVGNDSVNNAGHTWVCDGYDVSNNFHMNWGWGGADNGYFAPNALLVAGYNFDWWDEAVIGIEPPAVSAYFSGTPTFGCPGLSISFKDSSIANSPITAYKWSFPGGSPATSAVANPTVVYSTPGTYDVTEIITNINGTDTMVRKAYVAAASTGALPLVQGFQSPTFPPSGWVNNNPGNYNYTWQLNTSVGGYGASTQCMYFNNAQAWGYWATIKVGLWNPPPAKASVDVVGEKQQMYTPEYNFTGIASPVVYFDVAYAPYCINYTANNYTYSDTLAIYYSTDCGATFHQVYSKGGMTLNTTGKTVVTGADTNSNGVFVPLNNNWRTDTIKIPAIANASNVMFAFENRSGNGSPIYIDNINIPGIPLNVANVSNTPSVKVFPNPNGGQFTIGLGTTSGVYYVKIYNVLGQEVYTAQLKNDNTQVNLNSQPKGVYIYRIYSEKGSFNSTGRLVIE